tara:strand:+ start:11693 stop:16942 length:5250 start_codon:yes stop_codon:yes gene_type:complete
MATLTSIAASLNIDTKQFKKELAQAQNGLNTFQNAVGSLNKAMTGLAIGGLAVVVAGLSQLAKSTVQTGVAFEKSLSTLGAIKGFTDLSDATSEASLSMQQLEKTARDLGKSTAFSATEASNAMIELGRAGLTASEISAAIAPSLFLAGSSATDLTSATSLMAATMKQFGLATTDTTRIADVFTIAQQETMLSMESLTNAMKFAGTVGSALGMSLEETTAAVGMFRDLGVQGATAGTQFRQMMISLANPTKKAEEALERYNLSVDDVNPKVRSFKEIIETLSNANMDLADITQLVGKRASGSVTKLTEQFRLASQGVGGTTFKFDELVQKFEEGGGRAEETYNSMIDNVAGRFAILKSAFEELQLTIFDTFADPLKEVIGGDDNSGLIGLVNMFTETFQASSALFQSMFADMFGETLKNINENQEEIAAGFISIITQAVRLTQTIVSLIPLFITLGKAIVAATVAAGVFKLTSAITLMVSGVQAGVTVFGALRVAMLAFIASSGGILPLIAGFTALVGVVTAFAVGSSNATKEQERYTKAVMESRDAIKRMNDERIKGGMEGVSTGVDRTKDLNAIENELELRGELTDEIERGLDTLDRMTDKQVQRGLAEGNLFRIMVDGKNIIVDHAMALALEASSISEVSDVSERLTEEQEKLNNQREESKILMQQDMEAIQDVKDAYDQFANRQITQIQLGKKVSDATQMFSGSLADVKTNGGNTLAILRDMEAQLSSTMAMYNNASAASRNFNDGLAAAEQARIQAKAKADAKAIADEEARRQSQIKKYRADFKKALEARKTFEEKLQSQLDVLRAHETEQVAVALEQRLAQVKTIYDQELKFIGNNTKKRLALEKDYQESVLALTEQATIDILQSQIDRATELEAQNIRFGQNEIDRIKEEEKQKIDAELTTFETLTNANEVAANERLGIIEKQIADGVISQAEGLKQIQAVTDKQRNDNKAALQAFSKVEEQIILDSKNKQAQIMEDIDRQISENRLSLAKKGVLQELDIEQQKSIQLLKEAGTDQERIAKLEEIFRQQRLNAEREVIAQFSQPYGEYTSEIDRLNKDLNGKLNERSRERLEKEKNYLEQRFALEQKLANVEVATGGLSEEDRAAAIARVQTELDALDQEFEKKGSSFGGKLIQSFKMAAGVIKEVFSGVFQAIGKSVTALSNGIKNGLSFVTGGAFTTDIGGLLTQATQASQQAKEAQQGERDSLQQQLQSGEISQEQFQRETERLDQEIDPAALASDFVDGLVGQAKDFAISIAEQAPLIINGLAVAIPELIEVLVEQIPKLIIALGEGLPTVVLALVDGIIALLPVLADALLNDALPNIINGIVILLTEKLPQLADTLLPIVQNLVQFIITEAPKITSAIVGALPDVVDFVVQAITAILTGIPQLLSTLLAAIPTIITELLGGVGEIIQALFNAIPIILNELILGLPDIIDALLTGLLGILVDIAKSLPDLIDSIIALIPTLLTALLEVVVNLIVAIVDALPEIIEGLIGLLPVLIENFITLFPTLIVEIIKMLPMLVSALVGSIFELIFKMLPKLVLSLVSGIVEGIIAGVLGIVDVVKELFEVFPEKLREAGEFLRSIPKEIGDALRESFKGFTDFFKDAIAEITSLGREETDTFGDTPNAIRAGSRGMTASFAANDYIIAAQRPMELLRQAMEAVGSNIPRSLTSSVAQAFPPQQNNSSNQSSTTNVNIIAEGRLLDEIQIKALDRGHAPQMERKLKRNRGSKVGFDRGRFNQFSS